MNEHAFLPGEFTRVKTGPRWRLCAHVKDVCLSGDVEDEKYDYAYVVVKGRNAFVKTARLEPA